MGTGCSVRSVIGTLLAPTARLVVGVLAQTGDGGDGVDVDDVVKGVDGCGEGAGALCSRVYEWTGNQTAADVTQFFANNVMRILIIVAVTFVVLFLVKRLIHRAMHRVTRSAINLKERTADDDLTDREKVELEQEGIRLSMRTDTLSGVLYSIARVFVWAITATLVLAELGLNIGPLLAGAGIIGVALGFGAQTMVRDFLSGIFMISEDQFGVGDVVDLGEATGTVERITLRTTVLRDIYGTVWHVPNGEVVRVGNQSQHWSKALLDVGVAYGTDVDQATEVLRSAAQHMADDPAWRSVFLDEPEVLGIESLAADCVTIRVSVRTRPARQWEVQRELNRRFKLALDEAGIEIPFPQRTVWFRNESVELPAADALAPEEPGPPDDVTGRT